MFENIEAIVWDWNGTLLNDAELCVRTINGMLQKRNIDPLTISGYQDVFCFPVKDYYEKIGFDFDAEPFEIPAREFIDQYNSMVHRCELHQHTQTILHHFKAKGFRQFILSAMKQDALDSCLQQHSITHFFEHVSGLDNHYAASKLDNGIRLIDQLNLRSDKLVIIGDTVHDFEVATELGCMCILVANGHQSRKILESTGTTVIDNLEELMG